MSQKASTASHLIDTFYSKVDGRRQPEGVPVRQHRGQPAREDEERSGRRGRPRLRHLGRRQEEEGEARRPVQHRQHQEQAHDPHRGVTKATIDDIFVPFLTFEIQMKSESKSKSRSCCERDSSPASRADDS